MQVVSWGELLQVGTPGMNSNRRGELTKKGERLQVETLADNRCGELLLLGTLTDNRSGELLQVVTLPNIMWCELLLLGTLTDNTYVLEF